MKMSNEHEVFNGLCCGCDAAVKQEEVDPDKLYTQWLCGRCRKELEQLPPRHATTFIKLQREMTAIESKVRYLERNAVILKGFISAHGLNPDAAEDSYANVVTSTSAPRNPSIGRLGSDMKLAEIKLREVVGMNIKITTRGMSQRQIDYCWEVIDIVEKHFPNSAHQTRYPVV